MATKREKRARKRAPAAKTGSARAKRAPASVAHGANARRRAVEAEVLAQFRGFYGGEEPLDEILSVDPNDLASDPAPFYESLSIRFGVDGDPNHPRYGGFGGTIEDTIEFLTARWDGVLRDEEYEG